MVDGELRRCPALRSCSASVLVAFSGGPDSLALLCGLQRLIGQTSDRGSSTNLPAFHVAHVDHGMDERSAGRARLAHQVAEDLGFACTVLEADPIPRTGHSVEAWAREQRYRLLGRQAERLGAEAILVAHHADDQAETVVLRMLFGSGLDGLAGMSKERGLVKRPLLDLSRSVLHSSLGPERELALSDPSNQDLQLARNLVRHRLLPWLAGQTGSTPHELRRRLLSLGSAAARTRDIVEGRLTQHLGLAVIYPAPRPGDELRRRGIPMPRQTSALHATRQDQTETRGSEPTMTPALSRQPIGGASVQRDALEQLPSSLLGHALALMHRSAGRAYPPRREAREELGRQLRQGNNIGCDCGEGWRWCSEGDALDPQGPRRVALRPARANVLAPFSYTMKGPGLLALPELSLRLRLRPGRFQAWMQRGEPHRAGLAIPAALAPTDQEGSGPTAPSQGAAIRELEVTVRNRRAGDRLQPFGHRSPRRLKDLFIDHRLSRPERDFVPLVCIGGQLAWVPSLTIAEPFRPRPGATIWIAELEPLPGPPLPEDRGTEVSTSPIQESSGSGRR